MKKVFITTISLQGRNGLEKLIYHPVGFQFFEKERETSFPIIPVIAEHLDRKEEIEVIAIRFKNQDVADNYQYFLEELKGLGIGQEQVKAVEVPENQNDDTLEQLFMNLIRAIPNHSEIRACVTFGTKPVSVVVTMALNLADKLLFDVEVDGIYYGEIQRRSGTAKKEEAKIYDMSVLMRLSNLIDLLYLLELNDPMESLEKLLQK